MCVVERSQKIRSRCYLFLELFFFCTTVSHVSSAAPTPSVKTSPPATHSNTTGAVVILVCLLETLTVLNTHHSRCDSYSSDGSGSRNCSSSCDHNSLSHTLLQKRLSQTQRYG